ncbi:FG-GAP-like repeat-containing protein [Mucilaginibacter psychrotolerans]|uniref:T9SS type A sorting domain-containing protein n=1 Tax=Mucilaginibacter psychrotolerans TaxID=1524096 RepID=A0A4Y8S9L9_9SPHI|nr:FG-GAP-like repeat-containing protein [Mucilaginibacter psychrotolerans]TFF35668.1 T9SS type A sorting domain-containing protein [Mucilaginibacter psychrotolerans]
MKLRFLLILLVLFTLVRPLQAQISIKSISPSSGPANTAVTINGSGFNAAIDKNLIYFGTIKANVTSASTSSITVTVPAGATYSALSVLNTATNLKALSSQYFNVTFPVKQLITASNFDITDTLNVQDKYSVAAIGDLDGNGRADLLVGDYDTNSILIFPNQGNLNKLNANTFSAKIVLPTTSGAQKIEIEDMDGDGKPDIVVLLNNELVIFKNNASGALTTASFQLVAINTPARNFLAVADMDSDGKPDIITVTMNPDITFNITILKNTATAGTFSTASFVVASSFRAEAFSGNELLIRDLNGDNRPEIMFAGGAYNYTPIYQNLTDGTGLNNASFRETRLGVGKTTGGVAVADIDGDNKPDILYTGSDENVMYVFKNATDGGIFNTTSFILKDKIYCGLNPVGIKTADFDGDGKVDVAVVNRQERSLNIFKNIATGTSSGWFAERIVSKLDASPSQVYTADLNNDNTADLVVTNWGRATITLIKNKPAVIPRIRSFSPLAGSVGSTIAVSGENFGTDAANILVYFDSRRAEVTTVSETSISVKVPPGVTYSRIGVTLISEKRTAWSSNSFKSTFPAKKLIEKRDFKLVQLSLPNVGNYSSIKFGDFDGDGFVDMVYLQSDAKYGLIVRRNKGTNAAIDCSTFEVKELNLASGLPYPFWFNYFLKDVNNDGLPDIVLSTTNNAEPNSHVYLNTSTKGNISFGELNSFANFDGIQAVEDIDNDGRLDYVTASGIFRNRLTENETRVPYKNYVRFYGQPNSFSLDQLMDVDGDGKIDAFSGSSSTGFYIRKNAGQPGIISDSTFSFKKIQSVVNPYGTYSGYVIQDLNDDGKLDVVTNGSYYQNISTKDSVSFKPASKLHEWVASTGYADINGDGLTDLLLPKDGNMLTQQDTTLIFPNSALPGQSPAYKKSTAFAFNYGLETDNFHTAYFQGVEDINNDGKPDIIFHDNGILYIFENHIGELETDAPLTISAISPLFGSINSDVKLTVENLSGQAGRNQVYFGTQKATIKSIIGNTLTVSVPAGAAYGPISVLDTLTKLSAYSKKSFDVMAGDGKGADFNAGSLKPFKSLLTFKQYANMKFFFRDIDNDAEKELIFFSDAGDYKSRVETIYKLSGKDEFNNPINLTPAHSIKFVEYSTQSTLADLNGDNKPELLGVDNNGITSGLISIYPNTSSVACGIGFIKTTPRQLASSSDYIVTDINNDGKPDIIGFNMYIGLNQSKRGDISFSPFKLIRMDLQEQGYDRISGLVVKDIDGDGRADVVVNTGADVFIYRNTGGTADTVTFAKPFILLKAGGGGITADDLDGDGKFELITASQLNEIAIYKNIGSPGVINAGTFMAKVALPEKYVYSSTVAVADMDGDGKPDIVYAEGTDKNLILFRNKITAGVIDSAAFANRAQYEMDDVISNMIVDDYNNDGRPDILLTTGSATTGFLQNNIQSSGIEILTTTNALAYTANEQAVAVDSTLKLVNTSANKIVSAKISITSNYAPDKDKLTFVANSSTTGNVTSAYDATTGILSLISAGGTASLEQWQASLRAVYFESTTSTPLGRQITFTASTSAAENSAGRLIIVKVIPPPTVVTFLPVKATKNTIVTIKGSGFKNVTTVTFGGVNASSFTILSDTVLTAVVDTGNNGSIVLTSKYGTGQLAGFNYVPLPVISPAGPVTIAPGSSIVLKVNAVDGISYQWSKDGTDIIPGTGSAYTANEGGSYTVKTVLNGQLLVSAPVVVSTLFTLPPSNFLVASTSASCKGANNGTINVIATLNLNYTALLTGAGISKNISFNQASVFDNLAAGTYNLCITVAGQSTYQQCYTLVVTEPKDISLYATLSPDNKRVTLNLSGSDIYHIQLNGVTNTTADSIVTVDLAYGQNSIRITSDRLCHGIIEKIFNLSDNLIPYPNPFDNTVYINLSDRQISAATAEVYSAMGLLVYKKQFNNPSNVIQIDMPALKLPGIYTLKLLTNGEQKVFKILKK